MRIIIAATVGLVMVIAGDARAQTERPALAPMPQSENARVDRFSAGLIAELLETLGLGYAIGEGPFGQPAITVTGPVQPGVETPGADRFEVNFFGCDGDGRCDEVSLVGHFQPVRPTSLTTLNRFNQGTRFTTAYSGADGELILSMDLSAVGGIGRQATMIMIAIFVFNMESFAQAIGYS